MRGERAKTASKKRAASRATTRLPPGKRPKQATKTPEDPSLLPHCDGPKLGPFSKRTPKIEFVDLLSSPGEARHSHVFEVEIWGRRYALKVFRFYHGEHDVEYEGWLEEHPGKFPVNQGLPDSHRDPFFRECRAYGAIIDHDLNGIITPECFGYLMLTRAQEAHLEREYWLKNCLDMDEDWDRDEDIPKTTPLRAIVKELMPPGPEFTKEQLPQMLRDLKTLEKIGVWPNDAELRNWRNGRIFDFSFAITLPHIELSYKIFDDEHVRLIKSSDYRAFDRMIKEEKIDTPVRAYKNPKYCRKLRSYDKHRQPSPEVLKPLNTSESLHSYIPPTVEIGENNIPQGDSDKALGNRASSGLTMEQLAKPSWYPFDGRLWTYQEQAVRTGTEKLATSAITHPPKLAQATRP